MRDDERDDPWWDDPEGVVSVVFWIAVIVVIAVWALK